MVSPYLINAKLRALGDMVRTTRENAGVKAADLAQQAGMSTTALSRFENRKGWPPRVELETGMARILGALGVRGAKFDQAMSLVVEAKQPNWLAVGAGHSEQFQTFVGYESEATTITAVSLVHIPGLLQTRDFAKAVLATPGIRIEDLDTRVAVRMDRQKVLAREGVKYLAIIDEPVLSRPRRAGSAVLARQLRNILDLCQRQENVTVQVIPYDTEVVIDSGYTLLEFNNQPPVAYQDGRLGGLLLDQRDRVEEIAGDTDTVCQSALSPEESAGLISDVIARLESTST